MKSRIKKIGAWFKQKPRQNNSLKEPNFILTKFKDVLYCTSDNGIKNVTTIVTKTTKVFDDTCLSAFEDIEFFCRISKTVIVNLKQINLRNDWNIIYIDDQKFIVGRKYREKLIAEFEKIL